LRDSVQINSFIIPLSSDTISATYHDLGIRLPRKYLNPGSRAELGFTQRAKRLIEGFHAIRITKYNPFKTQG